MVAMLAIQLRPLRLRSTVPAALGVVRPTLRLWATLACKLICGVQTRTVRNRRRAGLVVPADDDCYGPGGKSAGLVKQNRALRPVFLWVLSLGLAVQQGLQLAHLIGESVDRALQRQNGVLRVFFQDRFGGLGLGPESLKISSGAFQQLF